MCSKKRTIAFYLQGIKRNMYEQTPKSFFKRPKTYLSSHIRTYLIDLGYEYAIILMLTTSLKYQHKF